MLGKSALWSLVVHMRNAEEDTVRSCEELVEILQHVQ